MSIKRVTRVEADTNDMLRRFYTLDNLAAFLRECSRAGIPGDQIVRTETALAVEFKRDALPEETAA